VGSREEKDRTLLQYHSPGPAKAHLGAIGRSCEDGPSPKLPSFHSIVIMEREAMFARWLLKERSEV